MDINNYVNFYIKCHNFFIFEGGENYAKYNGSLISVGQSVKIILCLMVYPIEHKIYA